MHTWCGKARGKSAQICSSCKVQSQTESGALKVERDDVNVSNEPQPSAGSKRIVSDVNERRRNIQSMLSHATWKDKECPKIKRKRLSLYEKLQVPQKIWDGATQEAIMKR